METPASSETGLTMADGRHFTGAIYPRLDRWGFEKLAEYEDRVARLESGEAVSDDEITAVTTNCTEYYVGYFSRETQRAIEYVTSGYIERAPGRDGPRETAQRTLLDAFETECIRCGVNKDGVEEYAEEIVAGWDVFARATSDYLTFAYQTFMSATANLRRADPERSRRVVADEAYKSFQNLLVTMDSRGTLPREDTTVQRTAIRLHPRREKSPRTQHQDILNTDLKQYKLPDAGMVMASALKAGYIEKAKMVYGEQPADLSSGLRGDPDSLYNRPKADEVPGVITRPRLPMELAEEVVNDMVKYFLFGNSKVSEALDAWCEANGRKKEREIRKLLAFRRAEEGIIPVGRRPIKAVRQTVAPGWESPKDIPGLAACEPYVAKISLRALLAEYGGTYAPGQNDEVPSVPGVSESWHGAVTELGSHDPARSILLDPGMFADNQDESEKI